MTDLQGGLVTIPKKQESRLSPALSKKNWSLPIPVLDNRGQGGQIWEQLPEAADCKTTTGPDPPSKHTQWGSVKSTMVPIARQRSIPQGLNLSGESLKGFYPEAEACQTKSRALSPDSNLAVSGIKTLKLGGLSPSEYIPKPLLRKRWNLQDQHSKRHSEWGMKERDNQLRLIQAGNTRAKQHILGNQSEAQDSQVNPHSSHLPLKSKRGEHILHSSTRIPQTLKEKFVEGLPHPTVKIQDTRSNLMRPSKQCSTSPPHNWNYSKEQNQKEPCMPQISERFSKQRLALNSDTSLELLTAHSQPQCKEITPKSAAQSFLHTDNQDPLPLLLQSADVGSGEMTSQDGEYIHFKQVPHIHKKGEFFKYSDTYSESSFCDKTALIKETHTDREQDSRDTCCPPSERGHFGNSSPRLEHGMQQQTKIPDFSKKRKLRRRNLYHTDGVAWRGFPSGSHSKTMDSARGITKQNQLTLSSFKQEHSLCDFGPTACDNKTEHAMGHNPDNKPDFCPSIAATDIMKDNESVLKLSHTEPPQTGSQSCCETDYSANEWTVRWLLSIDQNQPKMFQSCPGSSEVSKQCTDEIRCSSLQELDPPPSSWVPWRSQSASEESQWFPEPTVHAESSLALVGKYRENCEELGYCEFHFTV